MQTNISCKLTHHAKDNTYNTYNCNKLLVYKKTMENEVEVLEHLFIHSDMKID